MDQEPMTKEEELKLWKLIKAAIRKDLGKELAEAEGQIKAHFKDQQYHYWEGVCNGIETAIDALQRLESASIADPTKLNRANEWMP